MRLDAKFKQRQEISRRIRTKTLDARNFSVPLPIHPFPYSQLEMSMKKICNNTTGAEPTTTCFVNELIDLSKLVYFFSSF